jgi:hypothetical protein
MSRSAATTRTTLAAISREAQIRPAVDISLKLLFDRIESRYPIVGRALDSVAIITPPGIGRFSARNGALPNKGPARGGAFLRTLREAS